MSYNLPPPNPNIIQWIDTCENSRDECPHQSYPDHQEFLDHIVWIIMSLKSECNQKSITHAKCINNLMKTRYLCSFSVNHLFAKVSWFKYICIFNGCHLSNDAVMLLGFLLNSDLSKHPKAYKMMPKSCQLYNKWDNKSEHAFRTMIEFNFMRIEDGIGQHPGDYRDNAAVYCISWLFLSIKHWNQFQLLCFVKNFWLELKAMALFIGPISREIP